MRLSILSAAALAMALLNIGCGGTSPQADAGSASLVTFVVNSMQPDNNTCIRPPASAPGCWFDHNTPWIPMLSVGAVIDQNLGDTLTTRWFIDYDGKSTTAPAYEAVVLGAPDVIGRRAAGISYAFDSSQMRPSVHMVTVEVSNGFAFRDHDYSTVPDGMGSAIWAWCIDTTTCTNSSP